LARAFGSPNRSLTHQVVTRWYRAPELLFGARSYGGGVDIWAIGCIFAELMLRNPYLPGNNDIHQLQVIFAALGTPTEESWPGLKLLPDYLEFEANAAPPLRQLFSAAGDDALDLLSWMLRFDPNARCTATEALKHPYFSNFPSPTQPSGLPKVDRDASLRREKEENEQQRMNLKRKEFEDSGPSLVAKRLNMEAFVVP